MTAREVIAALGLERHPEGGWYRQTWAAPAAAGARPPGTCIYFLLEAGQSSDWHRVDAAEIWHFYAGTPLTLSRAATLEGPAEDTLLGPDLARGEVPQAVAAAGHWQAASAGTGWALVGCTVSPGFVFAGFEMAPAGTEVPRG